MAVMERSTPEDGDVVVQQDTRDGRCIFVLHIAPGPDQLLLHSRDTALAAARGFATRQQVRVWLTKGDFEFTVADDFRADAKVC
jgi:hypothetical protein